LLSDTSGNDLSIGAALPIDRSAKNTFGWAELDQNETGVGCGATPGS